MNVEWDKCVKTLNLEDVQGALCEDGAKGGRQAELYQTLQMSHFLCFCFLSCLFQSAAVYQGKASAQERKVQIKTKTVTNGAWFTYTFLQILWNQLWINFSIINDTITYLNTPITNLKCLVSPRVISIRVQINQLYSAVILMYLLIL